MTGHQTSCDTFAKDTRTYLYLHRVGQPEQSSNLIMRYDGSEPYIEWIDRTHVRLHLAYASSITRQVVNLNGVEIEYRISHRE